MGSRGSFETRASCNLSSFDKNTVLNTTVIPRLSAGGCVSINSNMGRRQEATKTKVRAGTMGIDNVVEFDEESWFYESFK